MKFLVDTNVFIPLEPSRYADLDDRTVRFAELVKQIAVGRHQVYLHPAQRVDIGRDKNEQRKQMHEVLFGKYPELPEPPAITDGMISVIGRADSGTNDWVDDALLAAVNQDAVDFLVTEDGGIHRKARRLALHERVVTVADALQFVSRLLDKAPPPPPAVISLKAHQLDSSDPIFDGLRSDYSDFDEWLRRAKRDHRQTWAIRDPSGLAAVCIVKPEGANEYGISGRVLKMCCFKVAEAHGGLKYGELLLKTVLDYSTANDYSAVYVTAFEKHGRLIDMLSDFGFERISPRSNLREIVLVKTLAYTAAEKQNMGPLEFNVKFGPPAMKLAGISSFLIPIRPKYHRLLFPEADAQLDLMAGDNPSGNCIRKAYLCNSRIKTLRPGSAILFYRSADTKALTVAGVVETMAVSSHARDIAKFVGRRTVYSYRQIEGLCKKPTLAILFRQALVLRRPVPLQELVSRGIIAAQPQSISTVPVAHTKWLEERVCM